MSTSERGMLANRERGSAVDRSGSLFSPSGKTLSLFSPAKINLSLFVLRKRPDGFHEIATLMQTVSLGDVIHMEKVEAHRDRLTCSGYPMECDESNLILKALAYFRKKSLMNVHLRIHVEKHIPLAGGLGGGSSNLATALWGANQWLPNPLSLSTLQELSSHLSSDGPFFFSSGTAYVTGRGEEIHPLLPFSFSSPLWLIKPCYGLSTSLVYRHCQPSHFSQTREAESISEQYGGENLLGKNDLEPSAFTLKPELRRLKAHLKRVGFQQVCMTGSGPTFYCTGNPSQPLLPGLAHCPITLVARNSEKGWYDFPSADGSVTSSWTIQDDCNGLNKRTVSLAE